MSIKGEIQGKEINDYGYARIKVSGTWYGGDKKGDISADIHSGDIVEFEAYDKQATNGKLYPTYKSQSLRKSADQAPPVAVKAARPGADATSTGNNKGFGAATGRDSYWADKEARDIAKDPQIAYQGSYDRALTFTDLAIRNGAFDALSKAKPTAKLAILEAFVAEQAEKIMILVYSAKVPTPAKVAQPAAVAKDEEVASEETSESWS